MTRAQLMRIADRYNLSLSTIRLGSFAYHNLYTLGRGRPPLVVMGAELKALSKIGAEKIIVEYVLGGWV